MSRIACFIPEIAGNHGLCHVIPGNDFIDTQVSPRFNFLHIYISFELTDIEIGLHFGRTLNDHFDFVARLFRHIFRILCEKTDDGRSESLGNGRHGDCLHHVSEEVITGAEQLDVPQIHGRSDDRCNDADGSSRNATFLNAGDMLAAPEKISRLSIIHLNFCPHRDGGINNGKQLVKIRDIAIDDSVHTEDLAQLLGRDLLDGLGIAEPCLPQNIIDAIGLHSFIRQ